MTKQHDRLERLGIVNADMIRWAEALITQAKSLHDWDDPDGSRQALLYKAAAHMLSAFAEVTQLPLDRPIQAPALHTDDGDDNSLDDVTVPLGGGALFRMERMSNSSWWIEVTRTDGKAISFNVGAARAPVNLTVQEDGTEE